MIISQNGAVDLIPEYNRALRPIFCVSEGDANSRTINLTVTSAGEVFTIPEGAEVYVAGKKQDNTIFTYQCAYSGYIVSFPVAEQMSAANGLVLCELQIVVAGDPLGSANFCYWVEPSPIANGSSSESDLNIFEQAIAALGGYDYLTSEVSVLSARMDQFARLPDGSLSTAADAELADIRVEANGKTATTAGDAVRNQVTSLKREVESNTGQTELMWTDGAYIKTSDATVNINSPVIIPAWRYSIADCIEGDAFIVNGTGGGAPRLWAFTDSTYNVLLAAAANARGENLVITAPTGAAHLILNDTAKDNSSFRGNLLLNIIDNNKEDADFNFDTIRTTNVIYHKNAETVTGTANYVARDILTLTGVTEGDVYGIQFGAVSGEKTNSAVGYIYGYNGTTMVSYSTLRKENKYTVYTVPANVNKIAFTLTPSTTAPTTAIYENVLIYKGPKPSYFIKEEVLPEITISPENATFFHVSSDMLNPSEVVTGEFVNQANGTFGENSNYNRSDKLPVNPESTYMIRTSRKGYTVDVRIAWYTFDGVYVSGEVLSGAEFYLVTAPSTAYYVAFSAATFYFPMMIAKTDVEIAFEDYSNTYILPEYVLSSSMDGLVLNLPKKCYATAGFEFNIYFENITENWEKYTWNVDCSKGAQYSRGFKFTPADNDAGTYTLTITCAAKDDPTKTISISTSLIVTASTAGAGVTKAIIVLGDSTTANGVAVTKLHEDFQDSDMTIVTLGTRGTTPNNHEGRSGWTFDKYFTIETDPGDPSVTNPFLHNGTFDAAYYFSSTGIDKPDWFFINLGINDTFSYTSDAALESAIPTIKDLCDRMIASVQAAAPNTKIGLCVTIPPNSSQDAFGKAYNCGQTRDRYKRNNAIWVHDLIETYDDRETEGIYLVPIYTNLDTVYNMGLENTPVNARNNETYRSPIGNGGVHPAVEGYWQIADVYTAFLKAQA